ncbi:HAMP domain-containing histidine kinase [Jiangella aurantiaca]|uniref:histidine kinase n=2 Tax=Jiangella aurantiaca TaxID=2530373 RepID=A0A4R5AMB5_9ACTN|nr:HAMP domain-containing histidine kinase [Jiangella aurantiaca]
MFLVAGVVLLGTTYALFNQQLSGSSLEISFSNSTDGEDQPPPQEDAPPGNQIVTGEGQVLTDEAATDWLEGQEQRLRDSAVTSLIAQGGIALLLVGGAAAGFGWLVAGRVLAPLHRVTETARRIAAAPAADRGLHERIALIGPDDEVKELADTFDTMVARLDRSFDGQRRFVANASHELRTPLTLSRGLVELAMHRRSASDDVKRLGEDLLEINTGHERLISGLLMLAKAENEVVERFPVDLADVVDHVIAQTAEEAQQCEVDVQDEAEEAVTDGDALLLERLVHNLVENGIRHNDPEGGWVHVKSRTDPSAGVVELEFSNTGPVVPPYEVNALFEPFRRLGTDRLATAKGAGLGLSIVRAIARAHTGDATARPRDDGGLVVTVTLPTSSQTSPPARS